MKRILALTLCLVMVLGLFTGVASADSTVMDDLILVDHDGNEFTTEGGGLERNLNGDFVFYAYIGSVSEKNRVKTQLKVLDSSYQETTDLGPTVYEPGYNHSNPTVTWDHIWWPNQSKPHSSGYLCAEVNGVKHTIPIHTREFDAAPFTSTDPTSYVLPNDRTFVVSEVSTLYIAARNFVGKPICSDSRFSVSEKLGQYTIEGVTYHIYALTLTVPSDFSGTETIVLQFPINGTEDNYHELELTFTEGKNLTLWDRDNSFSGQTTSASGRRTFSNITYGPNDLDLPTTAVVTLTDNDGETTMGTFQYDDEADGWVWELDAAYPDKVGTLSATTDGITYTCPMGTTMPEVAYYRDAACTDYIRYSELSLDYPGAAGTEAALYVEVSLDESFSIYSDNGIHSNLDITQLESNVFKIAPKSGVKTDFSEPIVVSWGHDNKWYSWIDFKYQAPLISGKETIGADDYEPGRGQPYFIDSFEYEGTTYHMVIGHGSGQETAIDLFTSTGLTYEQEYERNYYFDFCTYSTDLLKYVRVTDENLHNELMALFGGTLKMTMVPMDTDFYRAKNMPNIYEGYEGWPLSLKAIFDRDCGGHFYVQVTGEINGEPYCSYSTEGMFPMDLYYETFDSVDDLNEYLQNNDPTPTLTDKLIVDFSTDTLHGQIYIPEGVQIEIRGNSRTSRTIFHGSLISDSEFTCSITNFHFIGAGGQNADPDEIPAAWPGDDADNAGADNYAIGGIMNAAPENCIFEGYYHAMHIDQNSRKVHFGGAGNIYRRNHTAIYMNYSEQQGGGPGSWGLIFEDNGTAIDIQDAPKGDFIDMGMFTVNRAQFINNDVDVRNESGQILWMPMNYFVHDNQVDQGNDINNAEKKRTPVLEGFITSKNKEIESTIPYPMAWDETFNEEQYYYPRSYTTKNELAEMYPYVSFKERSQEMQRVMLLSDEGIENTEDTVTITSVSGDEWTATMEITSPAEAESPAVYSRRTMMRSAPSRMVYSMVRVEQEGGIVALGLPAISKPSTGKAQTWVDESWVNVEVKTGSDETVSASVSNGIVTFDLLPGYYDGADGTRAFYFIRPTATAKTEANHGSITVTVTGEPDKGNTFTVDVPDDWKDSIIIVTDPDGEETEYEVSEDGSVTFPADKTGKYTLKEKKSGLSGLLGILAGAGSSSVSFTDVAKNAWYYDDVAWANAEGLMNGTGFGKFSPDAATSRAMIVTILWRLEGSPMGMEESSFSDVNRFSWYGYAVDWAAAFGIVEGYDGKFAPNDAITREQLAATLYRYAKYKGYDVVNTQTTLDNFTDADKVSDWALEPMQWAVGKGLINGTNDALNCSGTATRAQTAAILHRFFG